MILLDANYILRFLLNDDKDMHEISRNTILNNRCIILNEVFAEVVFVLQKVYKVDRINIKDILTKFLKTENIIVSNKDILIEALNIYSKKNLDFVDAVLCASSKVYTVKTFDKKLNNCIGNNLKTNSIKN